MQVLIDLYIFVLNWKPILYKHNAKNRVFSFKQEPRPKYRTLKASVLHIYTVIVYLYISEVINLEENRFFRTL